MSGHRQSVHSWIKHSWAGAAAAAIFVGQLLLSAGNPARADEISHEVRAATYRLGNTAFSDPGYDSRNEITAVVHYPADISSGNFPLLVLLHGSWFSCASPDASGWPCPPGVKEVPSYRGYDYLGRQFAARGYVVVSISANGINAGSLVGAYAARAHLINHHLQLWQQLVSTGGGPLAGQFIDETTRQKLAPVFKGHVDMSHVGTLGHSRGGKAVMWQASDKHRSEWPQGVTIRAVVSLAGVKFDETEGDNSDGLVTRIPFAAVTGTCDGAVSEASREYYDEVEGLNTQPVYWLSVQGANHNFYNTQWVELPNMKGTGNDSTCSGPNALSASQQRDIASKYLIAFYDRHLKNKPEYEPILTGARPLGVSGATTQAHFRPIARTTPVVASPVQSPKAPSRPNSGVPLPKDSEVPALASLTAQEKKSVAAQLDTYKVVTLTDAQRIAITRILAQRELDARASMAAYMASGKSDMTALDKWGGIARAAAVAVDAVLTPEQLEAYKKKVK